MAQTRSQLVFHGVIGGLIAATAVTFWFFVLDALAGQPFATPTALAGAALGGTVLSPSPGVVAAYTVIHYGVFMVLGIAAVWGMNVIGFEPKLRYGVVFGLGVLTAVHYGAQWAFGVGLMNSIPAIHVVASNALGGMLMMLYLQRAYETRSSLNVTAFDDFPVLGRGIVTGLIGAGTVALWFLLIDLVGGRPLFTPAALGSALFLGAGDEGAVQINAGTVAAYTFLHLAAFVVTGVVLTWLSERVEKTPEIWLLTLMALIVVEAGFVGVAAATAGWVVGALGVWTVVVANLLAVTAMGFWIWKTHPGLREKLVAQPVRTMV